MMYATTKIIKGLGMSKLFSTPLSVHCYFFIGSTVVCACSIKVTEGFAEMQKQNAKIRKLAKSVDR